GLDGDLSILGLLQQLLESNDVRAPGAEMLGSEVAPCGFPDIVVDVARSARLRLPLAIHVLKQHLPGQFLAASDDPLKTGVSDVHLMYDTVFACEAHRQLLAFALQVGCAQR